MNIIRGAIKKTIW